MHSGEGSRWSIQPSASLALPCQEPQASPYPRGGTEDIQTCWHPGRMWSLERAIRGRRKQPGLSPVHSGHLLRLLWSAERCQLCARCCVTCGGCRGRQTWSLASGHAHCGRGRRCVARHPESWAQGCEDQTPAIPPAGYVSATGTQWEARLPAWEGL